MNSNSEPKLGFPFAYVSIQNDKMVKINALELLELPGWGGGMRWYL